LTGCCIFLSIPFFTINFFSGGLNFIFHLLGGKILRRKMTLLNQSLKLMTMKTK
jgi:hypothetical protein